MFDCKARDRRDLSPELGSVERERERERAGLNCVSLSGQSGVVIDQNNIKMNTLQSLQAPGLTGDVGGTIILIITQNISLHLIFSNSRVGILFGLY